MVMGSSVLASVTKARLRVSGRVLSLPTLADRSYDLFATPVQIGAFDVQRRAGGRGVCEDELTPVSPLDANFALPTCFVE
jgi:hypothetical protein